MNERMWRDLSASGPDPGADRDNRREHGDRSDTIEDEGQHTDLDDQCTQDCERTGDRDCSDKCEKHGNPFCVGHENARRGLLQGGRVRTAVALVRLEVRSLRDTNHLVVFTEDNGD